MDSNSMKTNFVQWLAIMARFAQNDVPGDKLSHEHADRHTKHQLNNCFNSH